MKKQEFIEKLKSIAKKNGFEIRNESAEEYELFSVAEKDIWEGVEFVDQSGQIIKIEKKDKKNHWDGVEFVRYHSGRIYKLNDEHLLNANLGFTASTESAYVEQLKKEAFERFGEIKEGDRFERSLLSKGGTISISGLIKKPNYQYYKEKDMLWYANILLYKQGKWAKKISTPSVIFRENDSSYSSNPVFTFHVRNFNINYFNGPEIGRHLANEFQNFIQNKQNNEKQQ